MLDFQCWFTCKSFFSGNNSNSATVNYTEFIELMRNLSLLAWLSWSAMKRRILIGSLSDPNFAVLTAHGLISANCFFKSLQNINSFLVSTNLFTNISIWREIQLNVHKSDARIVNIYPGINAYLSSAFLSRMDREDVSI